ncbi:MAG TPA: fimbria/pilus periplasmic chaperone [Allosphingosinicella sp.]
MIQLLRRSLAALLLAFAALVAVPAAAMTVSPVVVNLTPGGAGMTQTISVENTFSTPLHVELRVEELIPNATGFTAAGKESEDLLVFPPQAVIQPGQTQAFRVQYVGDPELARSKHYYVTIAQLPVQRTEGQPAIQVLYNFQVLVSVSPSKLSAGLVIERAEVAATEDGRTAVALTVNNRSAAHGYLSQGRLRIVQKDRAGKRLTETAFTGPEIQQTVGYGLIAGGQTRRVVVPVTLARPDAVIEATFTPEN